MSSSARLLNPSEAAKRLGVSAKALRLYEQRGLVAPARTEAGWRVYGPDAMNTAAEVVALRRLGLSLAQAARVLAGEPSDLEPALATHQATLEGHIRQLAGVIDTVRGLRAGLAQGKAPAAGELAHLVGRSAEPRVAFDLPWPWGGERFELGDIRPLNYIIGPLGSGKTRLAQRLAEVLPGAAFLGMDRLAPDGATPASRLEADPDLKRRVEQATTWLVEDGATMSEPLAALLVGLEADGPAVLVIDTIEQGLDESTQGAVISHLRYRGAHDRPLFVLTRSSAILDLAAVGADEAIILCPANHSPPTLVAPYPGVPGYEAVATCLASPRVRARTEGMMNVSRDAGA